MSLFLPEGGGERRKERDERRKGKKRKGRYPKVLSKRTGRKSEKEGERKDGVDGRAKNGE